MNSFAVSNGDILEGLQRSSSAMSAMGQDLDSTIALFTGAQEILQDSQATGTALRNMSLRMRGFDEETEQVSADLVNITGKIIDLTKTAEHAEGVSIFTDDTQTHYKDFVDYFRELSEVWDEMSEKNQVALLNELFGKRGSQAGSALIKNFDTVEAALEKMQNSAGNADAEMEIITNSISYHLNALKETGTGIFQNLFEREDINIVVDDLTAFLEVIEALTDKLGLFGTVGLGGGLAVGIHSMVSAFKALKAEGVTGFGFVDVLTKAFPTITSTLSGISGAISTFTTSFSQGAGVIRSFGNALDVLGASAFPITATLLAVGGAIAFLHEKANEGKEANEKMQKSLDAYKGTSQEIEELNQELENTKSKIAELETHGNLTIYEKNELSNLQEISAELEKQIALKQIANEKEARQAAEDAKNAIERNYGKDAFSEENYQAIQEQFASGVYDPYSAAVNESSSVISAIAGVREIQKEVDKYRDLQNLGPLNPTDNNAYQYNLDFLKAGKDRLIEDVGDIQSYLDVFNTLPDKAKKDYQELIGDLERTRDEIWELIDPEKFAEMKISDAIASEDNSAVINALKSEAKEGKLTIESIQKQHDGFVKNLQSQGINIADFVNTINGKYGEIAQSAEEANVKAAEATQQFSGTLDDTSILFSDDSAYKKMLDTYSSQLDTLTAAKEKFDAGELETKDLIELQQTFGELNNYDMTNLGDGLDQIIDSLIGVRDETGTATGVLGIFDLMIEKVGGDGTEMGQALATMRDNFISMYDGTANAKTSVDELKESFAAFASQQTAVNTALKESVSATGLTQASIDALSNAYKELEGFDPERLFENTANGVHLNREYLKELNDELANTNLKQAKQDLFDLQQQLNQAKQNGGDTTGLEAQIRETQLLASQYQGLLSAYNAWQTAQSNGNERDSYESVGSGYEGMKEILDKGWYGDDSLNAYLDLILGAENRTGDVIADFEKLKQTIEGTSHSFMDYFQYDDDGKLSTDGLFNFIEDVHEKLGDSFATYDEEAGWTFDFTGEKLQEVADAFGMSTEMVELFARAMSEAGFSVQMGDLPLVDQIDDAKEKIQELQESGEISSAIDLEVDVEKDPIEDVKSTIDQLKEERINIDAEENPEAAAALDDLIAKLEQQYYLRLNLETNGGLDKAVTYVNEINGLISEVDGKPINISTYIEGNEQIQTLVNEIASLPPEVQTSIGIKTENIGNAEGILQQLKENPKSLTVPVNYTVGESPEALEAASAVVNYTRGEQEEPEEKTTIVNYQKGSQEMPQSPVSVTVNYKGLITSLPSLTQTVYRNVVDKKYTGTMTSITRAHASGTAYNAFNYKNAYANGEIALNSDEVALINEIGQESIIRDGKWMLVPGGVHQEALKKGDIILSAAQTKALINTGAAPGHGRSYANGTLSNAYLTGSGGRRRSTTTKKQSSGNNDSNSKGSSSSNSRKRKGSTAKKSSTTKKSSSKDDDTDYDWIETKIDRLESKIKDLKEVADNAYASFSDRNTSLQKEIDLTIKEIDLQTDAAKKYREEANKIKINDKWKNLVKNGALDIDSVKDKDLAKKITKFKDLYEKSLDCDSAVIKLKNSLGDLTKVKFENIAEKWSAELENLEHIADGIESTIKRRNALADDFTPLSAGVDAAMGNIPDYQGLIKNAEQQQKKIQGQREELEAALAEALANPEKSGMTIGSEGYNKAVADINKLDKDYNALSEDIIGWRTDIKDAYRTTFDIVNDGYEREMELSQHEMDSLSNEIDLIEEKGLVLSSNYYKKLSSLEGNNIDSLQARAQSLRAAFQNAMANGTQEGSKAWYDMKKQINEVDEEIQKHTKSMIEYNKLMHQTKWDNVINEYDKSLHSLDRTMDKIQAKMEKRDAKASKYVKFSKGTKAIEKDIDSYQQMIDVAQSQIAAKEKELKKLRKLLAAALADPNSGITEDSETYKKMVSDIEDLEDEIADLSKDVIDWGNDIASKYEELFDRVSQKFENKMEAIQHRANMISNAMDIAEAKGFMASSKYYDELANIEKKNIKLAEQEVKELQDAMNEGIRSGSIEIGSQAWYDMTKQIHEATEEVQEHTLSLIEYENKAREIQWDLFDTVQEKISDITDEAKFMIDLMSDMPMTDDDGNLTNEAQATMGLHAMSYNVYMNQADRYAQEMKRINAEIANDPANTTLIQRREELLKKQRESILAAEEEKQSIKSIVEDGINEQINAMKDLIEQYKNALDNQKDLYDYQKKIADQTKKIANLEKQLSAYSGDDSEENRARMQKLNEQLSEAREDLEETEYDRYISDQKKLLDTLYDDYETFMNKRLDNIDQLIKGVIDSVNINVVDINATLKEQAKSVGYTMTTALSSVWEKAAKEFTNSQSNRVENTKKVVGELVANGRITQAEGASIISALGTGDAQGITNATNIINQLVAEGKLSSEDAEALRGKITGFGDSEFGKAVTTYDENFLSKQTTTNQSVNDVETEVVKLKEAADAYAQAVIAKIDADEAARKESERKAEEESKTELTLDMPEPVEQAWDEVEEKDFVGAQVAEAVSDTSTKKKSSTKKGNGITTKAQSTTKGNKSNTNTTTKKDSKKKKSTATTTTTKWGSWFVAKKSNADKSKLNINTSIIDRLKYYDFDSSKEKRKVYYGAMGGSGGSSKYTGSAKQNSWMIAQMKSHGYQSGAKRTNYTGLAWVNEGGGSETIVRARDHAVLTSVGNDDRIYNAMASENLWNAANNPSDFITKNLASLNDAVPVGVGLNGGNNVMVDGIAINLEGIKDWDSFMYAAQHDRSFEKLVQAMTVDRMAGRNKNSKYNI